MSSKLTPEEIDVLSAVEQFYWEIGGLPKHEDVALITSQTTDFVDSCFQKEPFKAALQARGIDPEPEKNARLLTPIQLLVANVLLNTHDKRSQREKLAQLGVSSQQYHAWRRQPAFSNYLTKRAEAAFKGHDSEAYQALNNLVEKEDLNAVKLHFEMRGIYNPKVQVEVDVNKVVVQLIEIVQRHVKDPQVLRAIADDVELLAGGGSSSQKELLDANPVPLETLGPDSTNPPVALFEGAF